MKGFHPTAEERAAREEQRVREFAEQTAIGFGRLMQLGEKLWREHLAASGYPTGGEFTTGPCAALMVPCQCVELTEPDLDANGHCEWCCGVRRVTKHVRDVSAREAALAKHIAACPIGYVNGKPITHRSTTDADVVAWVARLDELGGK